MLQCGKYLLESGYLEDLKIPYVALEISSSLVHLCRIRVSMRKALIFVLIFYITHVVMCQTSLRALLFLCGSRPWVPLIQISIICGSGPWTIGLTLGLWRVSGTESGLSQCATRRGFQRKNASIHIPVCIVPEAHTL